MKPDRPWPFRPGRRLAPRARIFIMALEQYGSSNEAGDTAAVCPYYGSGHLAEGKRILDYFEDDGKGVLLSSAMVVWPCAAVNGSLRRLQKTRH